MSTGALLALAAAAASSVRAAVHIWPNPHLDTLEFLRFDTINMGNSIPTFASESRTTNDADGKNRNNAADWIRTAYHDMATYNIEDGTGGLDASIQFEMDRDENPGDGFSNTITFFQSIIDGDDDVAQYVSMADLIALGLVSALEINDGPSLPFRGGRIDATEANVPGVPNPTQSVEEHTASFARQGFNATEMIELIACGHSFGGVQNAAFPLVVDKVDGSAQGNVPFDSTPLHFDNNIATEFLDGTTQNPLVVSKNVSALSDARIFASDGNVTISALANSATLFKERCGILMERLINTVPRDVELTDVIDILPAKPHNIALTLTKGKLALNGFVRIKDASDRGYTVTLKYTGHDDAACAKCSVALYLESDERSENVVYGPLYFWQLIPAADRNAGAVLIDPATGIGRMSFTVTSSNGNTRTEDQGGLGFPLQDTVVYAPDVSCQGSGGSRVVVAVRAGVAVDRVLVKYGGAKLPNSIDAVKTTNVSLGTTAYEAWTAILPGYTGSFKVTGVVNGTELVDSARFPWDMFGRASGSASCVV